jgi:glutathione S-transferase
MQLIGMLDSPYVRRVAVALIVAKVPFEHRPISLFRHIDAFSTFNPLLKAPTLVLDDGTTLVDSTIILDVLASEHPSVAALIPTGKAARRRAARITGLALTVMEKAVQRHYERALRPPEKFHAPWVDRVMGQLTLGLSALDAELPLADWIGGDALGLADIAAACATAFTSGVLGREIVDLARYPNLAEFSARAEALPAFRAAPSQDGVTAPLAIAD